MLSLSKILKKAFKTSPSSTLSTKPEDAIPTRKKRAQRNLKRDSLPRGAQNEQKEEEPIVESETAAREDFESDNEQPVEQEEEYSDDESFQEDDLSDDENQEDLFIGELSQEEQTHASPKQFKTLSPEELITEQEHEIRNIADTLAIPLTSSAMLLRHFQWKREKLMERYLENPEKTLRDAGVTALEKSAEIRTELSSAIKLIGDDMCSICADDVPAEQCTALSCLHRFCNDCWNSYLSLQINEGLVTRIKCPDIKCNLAVDENTVKKIVSSEVYDKFIRFITKSFVEDSDGRVKWCPQPNCGHAITADMISGTVVKCKCGYRFCFSCHKEAHAPATCEQVKLWAKKCKDDSETTHWKYANTKDCPKCETPVEKNGGCNHMTCRQCKHEWCWVCIRPWKGHNDYYNCNKFLKAEKKKGSFFTRSSRKEKAKVREATREKNRIALERYLHFFERYVNHSQSQELEKQIRTRATTQVSELQKEVTIPSELAYIPEGTEELLECRNVLKYTYVFAYYLDENGSEKELFEYLQEDLEKTTEQLSETLESPASGQVHRLKCLNIIQLAKTRKENLLSAVDTGLTDQ